MVLGAGPGLVFAIDLRLADLVFFMGKKLQEGGSKIHAFAAQELHGFGRRYLQRKAVETGKAGE